MFYYTLLLHYLRLTLPFQSKLPSQVSKSNLDNLKEGKEREDREREGRREEGGRERREGGRGGREGEREEEREEEGGREVLVLTCTGSLVSPLSKY